MLNILYNNKECDLIKNMFHFFINNKESFEDGDFHTLLDFNVVEIHNIYDKLPDISISEVDFCNLVANMANNVIGYPHNLEIPFKIEELKNIYSKSVYNVKILKSIKIENDYHIVNGIYKDYNLFINKDKEDYEIYLYKDENGLIFNFDNKKDLIKFFIDNEIIIDKEMIIEETGNYFKNMR